MRAFEERFEPLLNKSRREELVKKIGVIPGTGFKPEQVDELLKLHLYGSIEESRGARDQLRVLGEKLGAHWPHRLATIVLHSPNSLDLLSQAHDSGNSIARRRAEEILAYIPKNPFLHGSKNLPTDVHHAASIVRLTKHENESVKAASSKVLQKIAAASFPEIIECLERNPRSGEAKSMAAFLDEIGPYVFSEMLGGLRAQKNPEVKKVLLKAIWRVDHPTAHSVVISRLSDPELRGAVVDLIERHYEGLEKHLGRHRLFTPFVASRDLINPAANPLAFKEFYRIMLNGKSDLNPSFFPHYEKIAKRLVEEENEARQKKKQF